MAYRNSESVGTSSAVASILHTRGTGNNIEITKAGYLFIALALAIGFAAINSGSNLLHIIFGVQLGVVVASGMLSERMVSRAR